MTGINKITHLIVLITNIDQLKKTGEKFRDAASAAWRRQQLLNEALQANGAVARRSRLPF